jgi:regulator of replication initiation timing
MNCTIDNVNFDFFEFLKKHLCCDMLVMSFDSNLKRWKNQPKIFSKGENGQIFSLTSPEFQTESKSSENIELLMHQNEELKKEKEALKKENEGMKTENKELKALISKPKELALINQNAIIQTLQNPENLVKIIPSSTYSDSYSVRNLFKYDDNSWFSEDKQHSAIIIEFQYHEISLTRYFLRSGSHSFPQSWSLEGSNDKLAWKLRDFQTDCLLLTGKYKESTFNFPKTQFYLYFKLTQVGKNLRYIIILSYIC